MSFPNFDGLDKTLQRPDVVQLAQLAEISQADLRILVLLRPTQQIIASTTKKRKFSDGNKLLEIAVLEANAHALYSQLRQLDPKFVICFDAYEHAIEASSFDGRTRLGAFLHPSLNATDNARSHWNASMSKIKKRNIPGDWYEPTPRGVQTPLQKLNAAVSLIADYCQLNNLTIR